MGLHECPRCGAWVEKFGEYGMGIDGCDKVHGGKKGGLTTKRRAAWNFGKFSDTQYGKDALIRRSSR